MHLVRAVAVVARIVVVKVEAWAVVVVVCGVAAPVCVVVAVSGTSLTVDVFGDW